MTPLRVAELGIERLTLHAWQRQKQTARIAIREIARRDESNYMVGKSRFALSALGKDDEEEYLQIDDIIESQNLTADGTDGRDGDVENEEEEFDVSEYPEPPQRVRRLPELLQVSGCVDSPEGVPDIPISNIITCNSDSAIEGSLYVCVPSEGDDGSDGHDWADESAELGAVAVLAARPLPGCLLPVVVVDDVMKALSLVSDEFYGACGDEDVSFPPVMVSNGGLCCSDLLILM